MKTILEFANESAAVGLYVDGQPGWPRAGRWAVKVNHPAHQIQTERTVIFRKGDLGSLRKEFQAALKERDEEERGWESLTRNTYMPMSCGFHIELLPSSRARDLFEFYFGYWTGFAEAPSDIDVDVGPADPPSQALMMEVGFLVSESGVRSCVAQIDSIEEPGS